MTKANRRNPFGLTYRECEVLEALIRLGSTKSVAHEDGVRTQTIRNTLRKACGKIGVATHIEAVIAFDRKRRADVAFVGKVQPRSVFEMSRHSEEAETA